MTPEEIDDMLVAMPLMHIAGMTRVRRYRQMQEKRRQSAAAGSQTVQEDGGEEMQRDPSSAASVDYEPAVVTGCCTCMFYHENTCAASYLHAF